MSTPASPSQPSPHPPRSGPDRPGSIGLVGGTGAQGRGLALRLAVAGFEVVIGSRDLSRAEEAVAKVRERAAGRALNLHGRTNEQAAACDVVAVVVPYGAQRSALPGLAGAVAGKVVLSCVNNLAFDDAGPLPGPVEAGSAAQEVAELLPGARVVGAFQNVPAAALLRVDRPVEVDVLLTGDDPEAKDVVGGVVEAIDGMRAVDAGPLRLSATVEDLTAVLVGINRRYRTHAGVRVTGLPDHDG